MSENNKESAPDSKPSKQLDLNAVEMVFGTPSTPKTEPVLTIADETKTGKEQSKSNEKEPSDTDPVQPSKPLDPDRGGPKPPLAGPESEHLDGDHPLNTDRDPSTVENGLMSISTPEGKLKDVDEHGDFPELGTHDEGKWLIPTHGDEPDYPYGSRFGEDRPVSPVFTTVIPDVNTYQQKKNLAQGMMDLALLSANANQLRYVLESSQNHPYFYPSLVFIALSIILQVAVGVGLIMNSRYDVKDEKDICKADKINNMTVLGIFLITIVNVFVTSFSVATPAAITAIQNTG